MEPGYSWKPASRIAPRQSGTGVCRIIAAPLRREVGVSRGSYTARSGVQLRSNYTYDEVEALVEGYEELTLLRHKAWIQVRLLDMWRAFTLIPWELREAVLLMGFLGYPARQAAPLVYVSHSTVSRRYANGLTQMVKYMNGGLGG